MQPCYRSSRLCEANVHEHLREAVKHASIIARSGMWILKFLAMSLDNYYSGTPEPERRCIIEQLQRRMDTLSLDVLPPVTSEPLIHPHTQFINTSSAKATSVSDFDRLHTVLDDFFCRLLSSVHSAITFLLAVEPYCNK